MPKPESVARDLTVQERVLLFCVGIGTDLLRVGVTGHTVQVAIVVTADNITTPASPRRDVLAVGRLVARPRSVARRR